MRPSRLGVRNPQAEVLLQPLVRAFASAIGSGVERCADVLLNVKESTQLLREVGYKSGVTVANDLSWYAKPRDKVSKVEGGDSLSGNRSCAWDELRCFRAALINDHKDGIEAIRFGQVSDKIHGHHLEGSLVGFDWDRL